MLKTLMAQIKEYKRDSILAPVFIIGEVAMEVLIPLLMASIIDKGVEVGNMDHVYKMGALMIAVAFCSLTFGTLSGTFAARASSGFAKNVRQAMFENIQTFSFSNIDKYSTAGLVTRLTTDVTNVQNSYQMIIRMCARAPLMLIGTMAMAFMINARLTGIFVGAVLFLGIVMYFIISKAFPVFNQVFKKYDNLNSSVQENVSSIRVVKAYVREEHEIDKFQKACENLYNMFVKAEKLVILNGPAMLLSIYTSMILLAWLGAKMIVGGSLTTGQLMSMFTYVMGIMMSLMMISMIFVMLTMSKASGDRIAEVINEKSNLNNPENPVYKVENGSISFENVSFSYKTDDENYVLKDIDFEIKSGETIGILGGTGSAKSSLVQLIARLYDVSKGRVTVGGRDVRDYDLDTLRNEVSMVLQKNVLFSGTIKDNLRCGNENATDEDMLRACKQAQADEFIQKFPQKYDTYIEQGGSNVSGGQKQRLCIARALLKNPKILILDDSTSAVDTKTDAQIRESFRTELPDTTKLIIAQRISSVMDADRILVLNEGEVTDYGTHEELLKTSEIYRDVYESQMKGAEENGTE